MSNPYAFPSIGRNALEQYAARLANLYAEHDEAVGPKNRAIAKATLDGFVQAAHIGLTGLGANVGAAPFAVEMDVNDSWNQFGSERPAANSGNTQRKAWHANMVANMVARWLA